MPVEFGESFGILKTGMHLTKLVSRNITLANLCDNAGQQVLKGFQGEIKRGFRRANTS